MKKLTLFLGVLVLICFSNISYSQLLISEDFTGYTAGGLVGQGSWGQASGTEFPTVATDVPLTYPNYNGGGGAYVSIPAYTATSRVTKLFTPTGVVASGNVYYCSFLMRLASVTAGTGTADSYGFTWGDAAGSSSNLCPKLYTRVDVGGVGYNIGISKQTTNNAAGYITWGTHVFNYGDTHLIVEKYVFNTLGAGHDDGIYLFVDPALTSEPLTTTAECQNDGTTNTFDLDFDNYQTPAGGIGSIIFNFRPGAQNYVYAFDGIRLAYGTSSANAWTNLVPAVTPVELTSFTAAVVNNTINLRWSTATEVNNKGFEIQRKSEGSDNYTTIASVSGNGTSTSIHNYAYSDKLSVSGKYSYRLKQVDFSGEVNYSKAVEADVNAPVQFGLNQNYPNPFNPSTTINFSIAKAGNVSLKVYNLLGQEVRTLLTGFKAAGSYTVNFNAEGLNSGLYLYKLETESFSQVKKMTLLK
jgi:hypothetical protein